MLNCGLDLVKNKNYTYYILKEKDGEKRIEKE